MSCITVLKYSDVQFAICTVHHEVIPRRDLSTHLAKCTGAKPTPNGISNEELINDDTSPIMTLQRLFQTAVINYHMKRSSLLPVLPSLSLQPHNPRSVCKLCLQETSQVQYTQSSIERLAHLESFHTRLYATYGANIRDLTAQFNNQKRSRRASNDQDEDGGEGKKQLACALRLIDEEVEKLYFETVHLVQLRDVGGLSDYVKFPSLLK